MHPCTVPQISACPPDTPQHCGYFSNGLRCRHAEHLFLRHAVKPCGATQSCAACRREARLPALRPCALRSLLRLRTGPSLPWLGRSPGQQSTGLLSFSGSPCCAWKTGAEHRRSPGQQSTGLLSFSGSPTGHSPYSGSPPGALANLRLTHGAPVRAGKLPRALLLHRPHPCRLGAGIPGLATVSEINARHVLGYGRSLWGSAYHGFFQFTKQKAGFLLCSTRPLTLRRPPVTEQPVLE
jgi:hypothetical protein